MKRIRISFTGFSLVLMLVIFTTSFFIPTSAALIPLTNEDNPSVQANLQFTLNFNGSRAFTYLEDQCAFGARPPGSSNLTACGDYIITSLENLGWPVQSQLWTYHDVPLRNILAGAIASPKYVLLAHYDTRPIAEMDPDPLNRSKPILGANDGASGVAALLELATILPEEAKNQILLLFVDAEDSGNYNGWEWIVGSTYYVNSLSPVQKANIWGTILLDMMGDSDLQLKREQNSTPQLLDAIWQIAAALFYEDVFLNVSGLNILDDHRPFLSAGIPAIDIIDFEYPYWHTQADTTDKCSSLSLEKVGRVVETFVLQQLLSPTNFRNNEPVPSFLIPLVFGLIIPIIIVTIIVLFIYWRSRSKKDVSPFALKVAQ